MFRTAGLCAFSGATLFGTYKFVQTRKQQQEQPKQQQYATTASNTTRYSSPLSYLSSYLSTASNNMCDLAFAANKAPFNTQGIVDDICELIDEHIELAPTLIRLSWHNSGSHAPNEKCANSASMRFEPECKYGANNGLGQVRDEMAKIRKKHGDKISHADLWILAGLVAIEKMGGPRIPFRYGRTDAKSSKDCSPDGRLPDAAQGASHIRDVFGRMGFSDKEAVALIGAHAVGECHADRSGFAGPWTNSKYMFSNEFFVALLNEKWVEDKTGRTQLKQFTDAETKTLMMLPADIAVRQDPKLKKYAQEYAENNDLFLKDFSHAFQKLCELGCENLKDGAEYNVPE